MGGYTGFAAGIWVAKYHDYTGDLLGATRKGWSKADTRPRPGEDGFRANERIIAETSEAAAASIRDKCADWRGYDVWAPMNAERLLVHMLTGD